MSKFPQLGIPDDEVIKTMLSRASSNTVTSELMAWMRVSSALSKGLILETLASGTNFKSTYGGQTQSGRVGVDFSGDSVYASQDRSLRPSPTIEGMSLTNNARGLSRKASFSIVCYTLKQAEALSPYFLEPGYTVLIEYGWNLGIAREQMADLRKEGACKIAQYNNWTHVLNKRTESKGSYDGFMGYITGGGMKSGDNETWILDVEVTTLGEIPAYLQQNRTGGQQDDKKTKIASKTFDVSEIKGVGDDVGMKWFMMMYNRLPAGKRTNKLKRLRNLPDVHGNPFSHRGNFVNMEPELADILNKRLSGETSGDDPKIKIPDGSEIFSNQSYIRLELAFAILNSYVVDLEPNTSKCRELNTYSYIIQTNNTVIRAHPHIFPTDPSILFIPNTNLPDFGLLHALKSSAEQDTSFVKLTDDNTLADKPVDACPFRYGEGAIDNEPKYAFPCTLPYGNTDVTKPLSADEIKGVMTYEADAGTWGYLRNLYINLDFFIGILDKANYVTKDCYYDILNGISSAVNGYWNFQIHERVDTIPEPPKADSTMADTYQSITSFSATNPSPLLSSENPKNTVNFVTVSDLSFVGKVDMTKDSIDKITPFPIRGVGSPFISSNINIDMPSAMQNSILGQRNSTKISTQTDSQSVVIRGLFSTLEDPVMKILNSFKVNDSGSDDTNTTTDNEEDKIRKVNFDLFMGQASVIPFSEDDAALLDQNDHWWSSLGIGDTDIEDLSPIMLISSWNDSGLLNILERGSVKIPPSSNEPMIFAPTNDGSSDDQPSGTTSFAEVGQFIHSKRKRITKNATPTAILNPMLLPITFEFEVHGTSGLSLGDMIKVTGLPEKYEKTILQIEEINHQLSGMQWITSVKTRMRNTG